MKLLVPFAMLWLAGCSNGNPQIEKVQPGKPAFVTNDTIPELRPFVGKRPVASYLVSVNDPKLERTFGVNIYETPYTFRYVMRMHYEAVEDVDTLNVPNFGIWPVIQVKPGKDRQSCIIGFLDKDKNFKAYKMLSAKGNKMKLTTLKRYSTASYRNVVGK